MVIFGLNSASVLAQVNFGANSASVLGIFLAVAGAALYFLRSVRPELSRDQDIFFAAVGLLCGFILIFQGWRLDPILQFNQLLLVGATVFFAFESIRLRGIATEQAKKNTPIVERDRPVSDRPRYGRYKAERVDASLDSLPYDEDYEEDRPRRIPGSRNGRSSDEDYYQDEPPRRSERRDSGRSDLEDRPARRRDTRSSRSPERDDNEWGSSSSRVDDWDSTSSERKPRRRPSSDSSSSRDEEVSTRPRKRRPPTDSYSSERQDDDVISTDYVDYKPIDRSEDTDNSDLEDV
jgi:hypothetical protein